jgi:hypothetical protein
MPTPEFNSLLTLLLLLRPARTRHTVSFADILRLAQRTLASADWGNPRALLAHLQPSVLATRYDEARAA